MALPQIPLRTSSIEIGGETVEFRSLSRKEALHMATAFQDSKDYDAAEAYTLSCALGVTEEEAAKWREESDPVEAGKLIDAILKFAALSTDTPKA